MASYHVNMSDLSSNPDLASLSMLHVAAVNGDKSAIEILLKKSELDDYKCDVNECDKYGRTALVYTIFGDWYDCAELLLRNGAVVNKEDRDKRTPLHWAAYLGKHRFINLLLRRIDKNKDWNTGDLDGRTPLHYAAAHRNAKCLRLLLKHAIPGTLDVTDREKKTALHWSVYYGNFEQVKLLKEARAKVHLRDAKWNSFLHLAVANTNPDSVRIVRYLLKINRFYSTQKDCEGRTPLHLAVANENESLVKELCMAPVSALDELDNMSRSALHYAVLRNNVQIVNILISNGVSLYKEDNGGATPLHYAAKNNSVEVLQRFLACDKLEDIPDKQGRTALMWAASEGSGNVLDVMLKKPRFFDVHAKDKQGLSALHFACISGHLACVMKLITNSADVRQPDKLGQTPLFKACQQGHVNIADFLMNNELFYLGNFSNSSKGLSVTIGDNQGRDENTKDREECDQTFEGESHYASGNSGKDFLNRTGNSLKCWVDRKPATSPRCNATNTKPNSNASPLGESSQATTSENSPEKSTMSRTRNSTSRLAINRKECIRNLEDCNGCTPLHFASHSGHVAVCRWLLDNGVDPWKKDVSGRTALHGAAFNGHLTCMALMLEHCPGLKNDRDNDGYSVLHRAAVNGHLEAVKMLVLEHRTFPNYRVKSSNLTPLDLAMGANQQDVTQFLIDHGGLTIAGVEEVASDTIKQYLRERISTRRRTKLKPLLDKHKLLTRESTVKNMKGALGTMTEQLTRHDGTFDNHQQATVSQYHNAGTEQSHEHDGTPANELKDTSVADEHDGIPTEKHDAAQADKKHRPSPAEDHGTITEEHNGTTTVEYDSSSTEEHVSIATKGHLGTTNKGPNGITTEKHDGTTDEEQDVTTNEVHVDTMEGHDGTITEEHDGTITEEHDGTITEEHDGTITEEHDGTITEEHDGTIMEEHDGTIMEEHDGTITDEHDGTITEEHDSTITEDQDGIITEEHDGTITEEYDGTIAEEHDGTFTEKLDGSITEEHDGSITEEHNGTITEGHDGATTAEEHGGTITEEHDGTTTERYDSTTNEDRHDHTTKEEYDDTRVKERRATITSEHDGSSTEEHGSTAREGYDCTGTEVHNGTRTERLDVTTTEGHYGIVPKGHDGTITKYYDGITKHSGMVREDTSTKEEQLESRRVNQECDGTFGNKIQDNTDVNQEAKDISLTGESDDATESVDVKLDHCVPREKQVNDRNSIDDPEESIGHEKFDQSTLIKKESDGSNVFEKNSEQTKNIEHSKDQPDSKMITVLPEKKVLNSSENTEITNKIDRKFELLETSVAVETPSDTSMVASGDLPQLHHRCCSGTEKTKEGTETDLSKVCNNVITRESNHEIPTLDLAVTNCVVYKKQFLRAREEATLSNDCVTRGNKETSVLLHHHSLNTCKPGSNIRKQTSLTGEDKNMANFTENLPDGDVAFHQNPIFDACHQKNWSVIDELDNLNLSDESGQTLLFLAAEQGNETVFSILLDRGADLTKRDSRRRTVLHIFALHGQENCVDLVLKKFPELINAIDCDNKTALHWAAANGHLGVVELLTLKYNALVEVSKNPDNNLTPLDCAILGRHDQVVCFLSDQGAKTSGLLENSANIIKRTLRSQNRECHLLSLGGTSEVTNNEITADSVVEENRSCDLLSGSSSKAPSVPLQSQIHRTTTASSVSTEKFVPEQYEHLPRPPPKEKHNSSVAKHRVRAPDHVVAANEKEKIFRLRRDWERISAVREKIQAASTIQRSFRRYLKRKKLKDGVELVQHCSVDQTSSSVKKNNATKSSKKTSRLQKPKANKILASSAGTVKSKISPRESTTSKEKGGLKSCFPTMLQSTSADSFSQPRAAATRYDEMSPLSRANLYYRSSLSTNEMVEEWLHKASVGRHRTFLDEGDTHRGPARRRTQSEKDPDTKFRNEYIWAHSLPDGSEPVLYRQTSTEQSRSGNHYRRRTALSAGQRCLSRETLTRNVYASPAAVSYNFAINTYHPLASRRGCKQPTFPFKTSTRVRPNSMRKGVNGWVLNDKVTAGSSSEGKKQHSDSGEQSQ